jgi:hypothetical protein
VFHLIDTMHLLVYFEYLLSFVQSIDTLDPILSFVNTDGFIKSFNSNNTCIGFNCLSDI